MTICTTSWTRNSHNIVDILMISNLHHIVDNIVAIYNSFITHSPEKWENANEGKDSKKPG